MGTLTLRPGTVLEMPSTAKSLLIIDDDRAIIRLLARVFESEGYTVGTALTGAEARDMISRAKYDLAIVDVRLPDVDGIDLIGEIKGVQPEIKVVMLTGFPSEELRERALERGADEYFSKPVGPPDLVRRVSSLLEVTKR